MRCRCAAGLLAAIAWTAAARTRNSYIPPHPGTKSYYTFFVRSAQGESSGNSREGELAADSEKVAADGPMSHRRLCKDFGWGSGAVLFAKSSFREISQANRESTRILAQLLFAKSSFDGVF